MPLQELNTPSGGWLNVFLDLEFECSTTIQGWKFHATNSGSFFATVWRKSDSHITLVGKNLISVQSTGMQSINVAVNDQICVRPGDVIGIHYTEVEDVDGVMPYQQSGRRPTRNNLDLSALVNEPTGDNDLPLHTSMPATTTDFKRVPALQPILTTNCACFREDLPIQELNTPAGGWMNVFLDLKFDCATTILGWEFHATRSGIFYATVWRPSDSGDEMLLLGKNKVQTHTVGRQTIDVAVCEQICVRPGDVIGVHYSDTDAAGVVPYEQMGKSRSGGVTLAEDDFSRLVNKDIGEDVLPIGKNMATTTVGVKRIPALRPIISNGPENE